MQQTIPLTRDLVMIGGGHTHALVLRLWAMAPIPGVRLTLISPEPTAAYSGMLPGHVAGHYPREALQIDLVKLARHAGARLILGRAAGIDRAARRIAVPGRPDVAYDIASIDIGITSDMPGLPGFMDHAVPAKPLDAFADAWEGFATLAARDEVAPDVAVIGGGVAGVELALAARHRLGAAARVTVIERDEALALIGKGARDALRRHMAQAGITLIEHCAADRVEAAAVVLVDGRTVPSTFTLGAAATRPQGWLQGTGLALADGFVAVRDTLQTETDPALFAAGDIAHMGFAPRPKAGVYAVRQAPILHQNLAVALTGKGAMRRYRPQRDYLKLISTGGKGAVADKWGLPLDGGWLWRWKDRIDRRFMDMFQQLPAMAVPALPDPVAAGVAEELASGKPLCGGCGAKVGRAGLVAALSGLPVPVRPDVLSSPGDDAAILACGDRRQVLTTDHVRAFVEDPWLLTRITAIHALGDVWSMGAQPQAALAQIILPRMSDALQARTLTEIMAAAAEVFRAEGAEIVGGHTSLGSELTVGFTVTGLTDAAPVTIAGARPGDVLILTKPIGTGVILAAEMVKAAPGAAVAGALASMQQPMGDAAAILGPVAHAMTDVTGFGLAGHLGAILEASGAAAEIALDAVPFLPGAVQLSSQGHGSTLLPANRASALPMELPVRPEVELLFDPQTAGGLLAAVPEDRADATVAALTAAGVTAAIIGRVTAGTPEIRVR